ncbi:MAG TPA: ATP-binding protein [Geopsychrobacteraceae bacterium]|nr:ATP-binding protein [Geopsychrobacteraceae bacterium]
MKNQTLIKTISLLVLVALITSLHYMTETHHSHMHDILRRLYYIPIILGGLWFAMRGGIGMALLASCLYAPHVLFQWGRLPTAHPEQYLEIVLYNVIGLLTGFLAAREHTQRLRAEENAKRLSSSYEKLRAQADMILEIEDQLRRADRLSALGELSAGMAHEIRNPLGSIRGTAEILQDAFSPEDRYSEFTRILISEVDRLNQVLVDFLRFAQPEKGELPCFSPSLVLQEVLQLTNQQARKNGVGVVYSEQALPEVRGDGGQFKQVFLNLVLNALQAMPQGGELVIEAEQRNDCVAIHFRDSGCGINKDALDRIFNPFYTTKDDGTGLGLAITHRIIHNHGGQISVKSRLGEGAEFSLCLPVAEMPTLPGGSDG